MPTPQSLPWTEPLDLASGIDEPYWVLLYSGVRTDYSGRYSYLAFDLAEHIESDDFSTLEEKLASSAPDQRWFGYLGYGLKDSLETLPRDAPNWLTLPNLAMMRFHTVLRFDHEEKAITQWSDRPAHLPKPHTHALSLPKVSALHSNMSQKEYLEKAAHIIARIHAGDLYQANLTRKFIGEFETPPDTFALFKKLCAASPAPYSAFLKLGDTAVLSSSPELFLRVGSDNKVATRPIKGTAPRFADVARDQESRNGLAASAKDRAENLMIVDLMRNDLSRSCIPGSVQTERLFDVTTHATIHHMSSTVTGQRRPDASTLDVVKHCFPPGSMTGAPKIRAMQLCSEMERQARGIYSGAIGWLAGDGSAELSVVIRTLLIKGRQFEFQVGGGIVADSTPEGELQEIVAKSSGVLAALNVQFGDFSL